jgi:hypothetical protein
MTEYVLIAATVLVAFTLGAATGWREATQRTEAFQEAQFAQHGIFYTANPCGGHSDCRSCAAAAGCGWCSDARRCAPMGKDGFPIRYKDDYGSRVPICAPYGFITEALKCLG